MVRSDGDHGAEIRLSRLRRCRRDLHGFAERQRRDRCRCGEGVVGWRRHHVHVELDSLSRPPRGMDQLHVQGLALRNRHDGLRTGTHTRRHGGQPGHANSRLAIDVHVGELITAEREPQRPCLGRIDPVPRGAIQQAERRLAGLSRRLSEIDDRGGRHRTDGGGVGEGIVGGRRRAGRARPEQRRTRCRCGYERAEWLSDQVPQHLQALPLGPWFTSRLNITDRASQAPGTGVVRLLGTREPVSRIRCGGATRSAISA